MTDSLLPIEAIIPLLEGDRIYECDFKIILQSLANNSTFKDASASDINHLCSRVNNYLSSKKIFYQWIGCKLFVVINLHLKVMLSGHCSQLISSLVDVVESKCFNQDPQNVDQRQLATLASACEALQFIILRIRSKPSLTREVLTPRLPAIISSLISIVSIVPDQALSVLYDLLLHNSTTFRPFGSKFEKALRFLVAGDANYYSIDPHTVRLVFKCLALVSFNLARGAISDSWNSRVNNLILELKSVLGLYREFIETSEDSDFVAAFKHSPVLPQDLSQLKLVFGNMNVDVVENPLDIFKVSKRINAISDLLIAYLSVSTGCAIKVPLGTVLIVADLLCRINTDISPIKSDIRDPSLRSFLSQSLRQCNRAGVRVIRCLSDKFPAELLPHYLSILASLDSAIPACINNGRIILDEAKIAANLSLVEDIVSTVTKLLSETSVLSDPSLIQHSVGAALLLVKPEKPEIDEVASKPNVEVSKDGRKRRRRKRRRNNADIVVSDLISHPEMFVLHASPRTLHIVRAFVAEALKKCKLSPSNVVKIVRFAILDGVKNKDILDRPTSENRDILQLLETIALYPSQRGVSWSVIPVISSLIGKHDEIMSILVNPRFPPFGTIVEKKVQEEEEEEMEEVDYTPIESVKVADHPIVDDAVKAINDSHLEDVSSEKKSEFKVDIKEVEKKMKQVVEQPKAETPREQPAPVESEDSDFEMPPIDVGEDESD